MPRIPLYSIDYMFWSRSSILSTSQVHRASDTTSNSNLNKTPKPILN